MRAVGETLKASGYYGLALRMPGHGTVPAGLTTAVWEDWLAAVRVGVRHVRERIGPDKPLVLVGYSNGGALVLKYALDEVERGGSLRRTRLVLISPMIGVPPFAWMARVISLLGPIPYFEKARWLDVMPEYNPFKYNSFPANAGPAIVAVDDRRAGADPPPRKGRPPEGAAAGARVPVARRRHGQHRRGRARAVRSARRQRIGARALRHQPVVGDGAVHRPGGRHDPVAAHGPVAATLRALARDQRQSAIRSRWSSARSVRTGRRSSRGRSGSPGRPRCSRSSHIALPFAIDDDVYGRNPRPSSFDVVRLGTLSPRGERAVLTVPVDTLMRVSCNPFFPYLAARLTAWTDEGNTAGRQPTDRQAWKACATYTSRHRSSKRA